MKHYFEAIILAVGIASCGAFLYKGITKYTEKDRCVTVKGLSEREVLANQVHWPIEISIEGSDIDALKLNAYAQKDVLIDFLMEKGIPEKDISVATISTNDIWDYEEGRKKHKFQYNVSLEVSVNSRNVPLVNKVKKDISEVIKKGVSIDNRYSSMTYEFTDLPSIKPEMVEEATKDARRVAEKFAEDAECDLGSIVNASQGQFSIDDIYYKPEYKKIRVVTTISYYLK